MSHGFFIRILLPAANIILFREINKFNNWKWMHLNIIWNRVSILLFFPAMLFLIYIPMLIRHVLSIHSKTVCINSKELLISWDQTLATENHFCTHFFLYLPLYAWLSHSNNSSVKDPSEQVGLQLTDWINPRWDRSKFFFLMDVISFIWIYSV